MIYTVTCNPSLDYIVSVDNFRLGMTNRTGSERILPGGKGLNVSMVLRNLGIESVALGFAAGFTGEEIIRRTEEEGLHTDFIFLKEGISRINLKLKSVDGTEINGRGPDVGKEEIRCLMEKLHYLTDGDILVLAGSIPCSVPEDLCERILERLEGRNVKTVVDAEGKLLLHILRYHPFLVKPNHHELGALFGVKPGSREEAIPYAEKLRELGALNVLVSMGGEGAVLAAADGGIYSASAPEGKLVNSVGAGDSMVAGFLAGWTEKRDYEYAFSMGLAAGSASAFSESLATREEVEALYGKIPCNRPYRPA